MSSSFSFRRFQWAAKRFYHLNQKNWLIGLLGAIGILLAFWLLAVFFVSSSGPQIHFEMIEGGAMFFYLIGGLALTSHIFHEIHSRNRSYQLLTLPATTLEKFSAAWFVSSLAYTFVAVAAIFTLSIITEIISAFSFSNWSDIKLFNPLSTNHLESFSNYFFYQSIFLLGAVYFKKNNFLKTVLVIITFFIGMFMIIAVSGFFITFFMADQFTFDIDLSELTDTWPVIVWQFSRFIFMIVILFFGYLQLKYKQIA
jgi:hypothetical protein